MNFCSSELTCQEPGELVTDCFEGALSRFDQKRFEQHLAKCDWCKLYLDQMRLTTKALGKLTEESIPPRAKEELHLALSDWKKSRACVTSQQSPTFLGGEIAGDTTFLVDGFCLLLKESPRSNLNADSCTSLACQRKCFDMPQNRWTHSRLLCVLPQSSWKPFDTASQHRTLFQSCPITQPPPAL